MANIEVHPPMHGGVETEHEKKIEMKRKSGIGGVAVETLAAVGAVVLSIIGLAGLFPVEVAAVAAIAVGVALLFEGMAIAVELRPHSEAFAPKTGTAGEIGVESLAGLGAITLGIIALVGVASPFVLLAVTAIVVGAGLIFAAHPLAEATHSLHFYATDDRRTEVMRGAAATASGAHAFAGVSAVVLGIIGLTMPAMLSLSLVAFLAVGGTLMLGSAAVGGRLAGYLSH